MNRKFPNSEYDYLFQVTHKGITKEYVSLGSYSFWQSGFENCPQDSNEREAWVDMFCDVPSVLVAFACLFGLYKFDSLDEKDDALFLELLLNPEFKRFCFRYFDDSIFNPEMFMDNCAVVPYFKDLGEFTSLEDDGIYHKENGFVLEIITSNSEVKFYDALSELLIDIKFLEKFEKDYDGIRTIIKGSTN